MHGVVVDRIQLTPNLVRVVLGGDGLDGYEPTEFTDQYVNALFVPDGAPYKAPFDLDEARALDAPLRPVGRRYTIRNWDPVRREVAIDFVVHGDVGFAGRWANRAELGDVLQFVGPTGGYAPRLDAPWHLLVGDESALPAIAAALARLPRWTRALVVAVVDDADHELAMDSAAEVETVWVHRADDPGNHGLLAAAVAAATFPAGVPQVFVHGEAGEVRAIRRHLFAERGLAKAGTSISPYWRRNFTDEAWREVKSAWLAEVEHDA